MDGQSRADVDGQNTGGFSTTQQRDWLLPTDDSGTEQPSLGTSIIPATIVPDNVVTIQTLKEARVTICQ